MPTERERMLAGELYDPMDPELVAGRSRARDLCAALNATRDADQADRRRILRELLARAATRSGCSVVTRDVPEGVLAAGNPSRVVREITP